MGAKAGQIVTKTKIPNVVAPDQGMLTGGPNW